MPVMNPYYGNVEGGEEFVSFAQDDDVHVSSLDVWTHIIPGDYEVIKAIRISWSDGSDRMYGEPNDDNPAASARFEHDEQITKMVIHSGAWVDSIYFESTEQPDGQTLGGGGGDAWEQDVGNGVFLGLWGRSGTAIDALATVFKRDD
ncbi:hypothetical protein HJFPF1_13211 [Paramyrothecium foliicola]|nr:hypothetical protein HJFPF1_13211 [Paramyrothecium foliicola]